MLDKPFLAGDPTAIKFSGQQPIPTFVTDDLKAPLNEIAQVKYELLELLWPKTELSNVKYCQFWLATPTAF